MSEDLDYWLNIGWINMIYTLIFVLIVVGVSFISDYLGLNDLETVRNTAEQIGIRPDLFIGVIVAFPAVILISRRLKF